MSRYFVFLVDATGVRLLHEVSDPSYAPASTEEETVYIVTTGPWGTVIHWMKDRNGELINLPQGTKLTHDTVSRLHDPGP